MIKKKVKRLYQVDTMVGVQLMLLFSDDLCLIICSLSLMSNKSFLFSLAKILKLSKNGKQLQWSKWSQV